MRKAFLCVALVLAVALAGCNKPDRDDERWEHMTGEVDLISMSGQVLVPSPETLFSNETVKIGSGPLILRVNGADESLYVIEVAKGRKQSLEALAMRLIRGGTIRFPTKKFDAAWGPVFNDNGIGTINSDDIQVL